MSLKVLFLIFSIHISTSIFVWAEPVITASSGNAVSVSSARVIEAPGGSYITGSLAPVIGYAALSLPHVHVTVYGARGQLLTEKVDRVNRNLLARSHLQSRPRASYVAFVPWSPSQITRVLIEEHGGHRHSES